MPRKSHEKIVQRRMLWIHPVSSLRVTSAAIAKAKGIDSPT